MIESDSKGWHGCYSKAGKHSVERSYIISHKDEILARENKKIRIKSIFSPDEYDTKKQLGDNLDIYKYYKAKEKFKKYNKDNQTTIPKKKNYLSLSTKKEKKIKNKKLSFHLKHCDSESKIIKGNSSKPSCASYNPNYDYLYPRLITGPKWKDIPGRIEKPKEIDIRDFTLGNLKKKSSNKAYSILDNGQSKCLVNMNKTTRRGRFIDAKDLRIRTDKPFIKKNNSKNKKYSLFKELTCNTKYITLFKGFELNKKPETIIKNIKNQDNSLSKKKYCNTIDTFSYKPKAISNNNAKNNEFYSFADKYNKDSKNELIDLQDNNNSENNDKLNESSSSFKIRIKIKKNNINHSNLALSSGMSVFGDEKKSLKYKIKAPDFSKSISRDHFEKALKKKTRMLPFFTPNYSLVTERPIMMAVYEKPKVKLKKNKGFLGIDTSFNYEPDKYISNYNNHKAPVSPNFRIMTSRILKEGCPLPTYMLQRHDRASICNLNDKALELNNFQNGKYLPASNSFFPKKSYNNIINYSFIHSKKFKEKDVDEDIEMKKSFLKTQANFNQEKLEQLEQEGFIGKIDGITFKTIRKIKERKYKFSEFQKAMKMFNKEEQKC